MTLQRAERAGQSAVVEETPIESLNPEPVRVTSPVPSLSWARRKMTLSRPGKVEPAEQSTTLEEQAVESPKSESERVVSPGPSLSWTRRRMTLSRAEKAESADQSKEQTVKSPKSEPERAATPPLSLPFMRRKMTIQRSEIVGPAQQFEPVVGKATSEAPKPEPESVASSPPSVPVVEKVEKPLRQGRPMQPHSSGPAIEAIPAPELTERNRRSIPTFDKTQVNPRSERTPEPVKIPEYTKAAPLEVKSSQEKAAEPVRVSRHLRGESAVTSPAQPAPKPLRRAETQSAAMISNKTSGESLTARHSRSESSSSITSTDNNNKLGPKTDRVKNSISDRAKRFSQTQDEPSDSDSVSPARAAFAARRAMFEKK